jgi:hypothetical protein
LLGKKSWNVYNQDNVDRVRRDEADAQAREEEHDRRTQAVDSERRLKLLRGQAIGELPVEEEKSPPQSRRNDHLHSRKRRRIAGEDETDHEMRLAREEAALQIKAPDAIQTSDNPITDSRGHIDLFPSRSQHHEKNEEAEAERAKKKREYEDQYTMRLSNAAGFKQGLTTPWYSTTGHNEAAMPAKDVWGNDDMGRREREKRRGNANDPLAAMKRGVKQLREVEKSRKEWIAERERELQELNELDRSRCSRTGRSKRDGRAKESSDLESFSLDSKEDRPKDRDHKHRKHRKHHRPRGHDGDSRDKRRRVVSEEQGHTRLYTE